MNTLTQGVIVLVSFTTIVSGAMVFALMKARAEEPERRNFLPKLLPFVLADALFMIVFVVWFLSQPK